ncbi:MAG: polyprenyl synthetase family protein [Gemmatimonadota bacterium]
MVEAAPPTLQSLKAPVEDRLDDVRGRIAEMVSCEFDRLHEVADYLLGMEGKLIRPTLLLLADQVEGRRSPEAAVLGAVVELVHVATLVHDDAVDHSVRRRGRPAVNARWTHQVAIILGDFLYSRAVTESCRVDSVEAIELLASAANRMTVGEMRQLTSHDALAFGEEDYYRLCESKTASLMAAACELGALFGAPDRREALRGYGRELGMAFQITDDLLDYTASPFETGKPSGQDLREHKVTLPLIAVLPELDGSERERVEALFGDPEPSDEGVAGVIELVERKGGLEYARERAAEHLERARSRISGLSDRPSVRALRRATHFVEIRRR